MQFAYFVSPAKELFTHGEAYLLSWLYDQTIICSSKPSVSVYDTFPFSMAIGIHEPGMVATKAGLCNVIKRFRDTKNKCKDDHMWFQIQA